MLYAHWLLQYAGDTGSEPRKGYRNKYEMMDGIAKEATHDRNEQETRTRYEELVRKHPEYYQIDSYGQLLMQIVREKIFFRSSL